MTLAALQQNQKRTGLVLSGGGVKGMAHIGLIKALTEHDIHPDVISGVSAGALVGALYANQVSPENMINFFKDTPLFKYNFFTLNKPGLFDTEKYLFFLQQYFEENSFENLKKQLLVTTTNLEKGETEYHTSGSLFLPLLASAALPPVFSPVELNGQLHADGAIMNNFPLEPLLNKVDFTIGCYTSSMGEADRDTLNSSFQISQRANLLMLHANALQKLHQTDLFFRPRDLGLIGVLDKKGIDKAFQLGYEQASRQLDRLLVS